MSEHKYTRIGHIILDESTRQKETFKYINEAKRKSRRLQMDADNGLGRGTVRVD